MVDRLWPRGISKDRAKIDLWAKDIAPSHELRKWFNHDPDKWEEFKQRYYYELESNPKALIFTTELIKNSEVTLIFSSKEKRFNNAEALREYIESKKKEQS